MAGSLPLEVFQACPTGRRPQADTEYTGRQRWNKGCVGSLARSDSIINQSWISSRKSMDGYAHIDKMYDIEYRSM